MPEGHWDQFLNCLSTDKVMKCVVCVELRNLVFPREEPSEPVRVAGSQPQPLLDGQVQEQALVVADPPDPEASTIADLAVCKGKRGRPPKNRADVPLLKTHLEKHRMAVYQHIRGARYFCRACSSEVFFQRETTSGFDSYSNMRKLLNTRQAFRGKASPVAWSLRSCLLCRARVNALDTSSAVLSVSCLT